MSQKGNCWDNAPQESFFGHMKDEIAELLSKQPTFDKVKAVVDDWVDYYNNERYQWDLLSCHRTSTTSMSQPELCRVRLPRICAVISRAKNPYLCRAE